MEKTEMKVEVNDQLGKSEKIAFASGEIGVQFLFTMMSAWLMVYYTDYAQINPAMIASVMFISKILDGVSDIAMGFIQEKFAKPGAKARPWLRRIVVPYAISGVLLFTMPNFEGLLAQTIYVFLTYNFFCTMFTMLVIPYNSLGALMTQDDSARETIGLMRSIFVTVVSTIVNSFTMSIITAMGGTKLSWTLLMAIYGCLTILVFTNVYRKTQERVVVEKNSENRLSNELGFLEGLKLVCSNKYWAMLTVHAVASNMVIALSTGSMFYYLANVVGRPETIAVVGMLLSIPMLFLIPASQPLVKKFGKTKMTVIGTLVMAAGRFIFGMNGGNELIIYLGAFIFSLGCSTAWCAGPMLLDTIEYGEWKHHVRQDGLITSAQSFGQKVGAALGTAMVGWVLAWTGYVGGAASQSPEALSGISFVFVWLPIIILVAVALMILFFYDLDKRYPTIVKELKTRNNK